MTGKQALEELIDFYGKNNLLLEHVNAIKQDLERLEHLEKKEKPKKPKTIKIKGYNGSAWVCPKCKTHIAYFDELGIGTVRKIKYCEECGQRLNLGGNEE